MFIDCSAAGFRSIKENVCKAAGDCFPANVRNRGRIGGSEEVRDVLFNGFAACDLSKVQFGDVLPERLCKCL